MRQRTSREHIVAEVGFRAGTAVCACTTVIHGQSPEDVAEGYQSHRTSVGLRRMGYADALGQRKGGQ